VILAQLARTARPRARFDGVEQRGTGSVGQQLRRSVRHLEQRTGLLAFCVPVIRVTVDAGECGDVGVRPLGPQHGPPSCERSGKADGSDGMPQIVLTIAEGAFAVLPGFAPMNGCQCDEESMVIDCVGRKAATAFDRMSIGRIVPDARQRRHALNGSGDDEGFSRVQIAARGVGA
jgi:hypothetical protein